MKVCIARHPTNHLGVPSKIFIGFPTGYVEEYYDGDAPCIGCGVRMENQCSFGGVRVCGFCDMGSRHPAGKAGNWKEFYTPEWEVEFDKAIKKYLIRSWFGKTKEELAFDREDRELKESLEKIMKKISFV